MIYHKLVYKRPHWWFGISFI